MTKSSKLVYWPDLEHAVIAGVVIGRVSVTPIRGLFAFDAWHAVGVPAEVDGDYQSRQEAKLHVEDLLERELNISDIELEIKQAAGQFDTLIHYPSLDDDIFEFAPKYGDVMDAIKAYRDAT